MTVGPQVLFADRASLPPAALGDIWGDVTAKVSEKAVESINKAIKDQLGDTAGAILGPLVGKGMTAIIGALGLNGGQSESDLDKVMGELAKVKETLAAMQGQLRKIDDAVKKVGELVSAEAERINQAAKYRDYVQARDAINAMWTTTWSLLIGIAAHPEDRDSVSSARALYMNQTVNFIRDTLAATSNLRNAVLKMFADKDSLFRYMAHESQPLVRKAIHQQVAERIDTDGMTLLRRERPQVWEALLAGPCGDVLRDMKSYQGRGLDGRKGPLTYFWYGESWYIFMETAHDAIAKQISASPLSVFMAEVNMAYSRALIILTIIYGRNAGLTMAANTVIDTLDQVAAEANPRYAEFTRSLVEWIGGFGTWGSSPVGKRPGADRTRLFGLWAAQWMDTSTNLLYPCSYVEREGKTYPCSFVRGETNVRQVAEQLWRDPNAFTFVYEKTGPHEFDYRHKGFPDIAPSLEQWAHKHAGSRQPMVQTHHPLPPV